MCRPPGLYNVLQYFPTAYAVGYDCIAPNGAYHENCGARRDALPGRLYSHRGRLNVLHYARMFRWVSARGSPLHSVDPTGLHLSVSCKQAMNCRPISVFSLQGCRDALAGRLFFIKSIMPKSHWHCLYLLPHWERPETVCFCHYARSCSLFISSSLGTELQQRWVVII